MDNSVDVVDRLLILYYLLMEKFNLTFSHLHIYDIRPVY